MNFTELQCKVCGAEHRRTIIINSHKYFVCSDECAAVLIGCEWDIAFEEETPLTIESKNGIMRLRWRL